MCLFQRETMTMVFVVSPVVSEVCIRYFMLKKKKGLFKILKVKYLFSVM